MNQGRTPVLTSVIKSRWSFEIPRVERDLFFQCLLGHPNVMDLGENGRAKWSSLVRARHKSLLYIIYEWSSFRRILPQLDDAGSYLFRSPEDGQGGYCQGMARPTMV